VSSASRAALLSLAALLSAACEPSKPPPMPVAPPGNYAPGVADIQQRIDRYARVPLKVDLAGASERERAMLVQLIRASAIMDYLFWYQSWGHASSLIDGLKDEPTKQLAYFNYGPWDRLDGNRPFVAGVGPKPAGANLYPADVTRAELDALPAEQRDAQYSVIQRGKDRTLAVVPYHVTYELPLKAAAQHLRDAAALCDEPAFANYLRLRATALETDDYRPSDLAWMDMKDNRYDLVIGAVENYEDTLLGVRTAYEGVLLRKDTEWSARLARYVALLPEMQRGLPVPAEYKKEMPGTASDLNAYDVLYYAGDANSGAKLIAINLPNDESVQLAKGTRRLQLKNTMQAKFERIMLPIARELIVPDQLANVRFEAFFPNIMFHEVAHGLGVKNTLDGKRTARAALQEQYGALEEAKADILGLYLVTRLLARNELRDATLADHYVTFVAGILRSVRFGAADAHGKANMIEFNYFEDRGAFQRDAATGRYRVDVKKAQAAAEALAARILRIQGDGDYALAKRVVTEEGVVRPALQGDLERLAARSIPVDVVFDQGTKTLGLE
jgi:hypothetical protein